MILYVGAPFASVEGIAVKLIGPGAVKFVTATLKLSVPKEPLDIAV